MAGETTTVSAATVRQQQGHAGSGLFPIRFDVAYLSTETQLNDVMQAGYLPPGVKVVAVGYHPTDLDTGIAAVVQKVSVGSTDIVTGLTGAQTGAASLTPVTQAYLAAAPSNSRELVTITTTTAAATGAAGTVNLVLWCYNAKVNNN